MLKSAGLLVFSYFSKWKLNCLDKARLYELRHTRALNDVFDSIARKRRSHLRAGFSAIAQDSWNTNMRQRILNKLHYVAFGKLKNFFDRWKYQVNERLRNEMEAKKARVIDMLVQHSMSDEHRALLRWAKNARDWRMYQYGQRIKASHILLSVMNRHFNDRFSRGFDAIKLEAQEVLRELLQDKMTLLNNMFLAFAKADRMNVASCFKKWASRNKKQRMYLVCSKIISNYVERQQYAIDAFWDNVVRFDRARKIMGIMMMRAIGERDGIERKRRAYVRWRDNEMLRRLRLAKKYMQNWIFTTSSQCNIQIGFWRWKFIITKYGKEIKPKHLVMAKKLVNLFDFTKRKMMQFGWFKVMIFE